MSMLLCMPSSRLDRLQLLLEKEKKGTHLGICDKIASDWECCGSSPSSNSVTAVTPSAGEDCAQRCRGEVDSANACCGRLSSFSSTRASNAARSTINASSHTTLHESSDL
jgi:hypothetical protein